MKKAAVLCILILLAFSLVSCGGGGGGAGTVLTFTVTYDGNGNTDGGVPSDSTEYQQDQVVTVPGNTGNLVKTGYSFSGWNTQADGSGTTYSQGQIFIIGAANVVLYAKWTTNPTYTVTYNGNGNTGGSVPVDTTNYEHGQTVTVLGDAGSLIKTGYSFTGWNTQANGTGSDYTQSHTFLMGSANVTLYAKWTASPTYTVTYNGNGNTGGNVPTDSTNYEAGQPVAVLANTGNLVRAGYAFTGWNTQANGTGFNYTQSQTFTMGNMNVTLFSVWTVEEPTMITPTAPTNLSAIATSSTIINLTWTDNANNEEGFRIERTAFSGIGFEEIATVAVDTTSYTDEGLTPSTTYYYRVRAYNSAGDSGYSDAGTVTTMSVDLEIFHSILSGDRNLAEGLLLIAYNDGWPVETDAGFLFVRIDDGNGPYALTGEYNGWQTEAMQREAGLYWIITPVPVSGAFKYRFVDGALNQAADPMARCYFYDQSGEYSLVRSSGNHLERWLAVEGYGLLPRTIRVWVPNQTATRHLYIQDGQNLFDPTAAGGGWRLHDVLGPTTMGIGIDYTTDRIDEYTHVSDIIADHLVGGKGDDYADFVLDIVRPLIESRYGTPVKRGVMGGGLGGLIAFHQIYRHPEAWDFGASLSGTLGWGRLEAGHETIIERFAEGRPSMATLYLDSGGGPGTGCYDNGQGIMTGGTDNYCENYQMANTLLGVGYSDSDLSYWWEVDATHTESAWSNRVHRPIEVFETF
jgi:uncharacterized repeat protein (TIGR02543 family)